MPLTLRWRAATQLPVEADGLLPASLATHSPEALARLAVPLGNTSAELGELFAIEGTVHDETIVFEGDLRPVRRIGRGLGSGTIIVRGDTGAELGAEMTGGTIAVEGAAGDYAGAEMSGGLIQIRGSAGKSLGSAYPGSRLGMREGVILVEGTVGSGAGLSMRRGLIAVSGTAGDDLGHALIAGSIFVFGSVGRRAGASMKRGTLALFGTGDAKAFEPLPTFAPTGRFRPHFLTIYLRRLRQWGFPVPETAFSSLMDRYNGDLVERGQGEILIAVGT
jgi:formylmethanofuran dehydrogenase subunit C